MLRLISASAKSPFFLKENMQQSQMPLNLISNLNSFFFLHKNTIEQLKLLTTDRIRFYLIV